MHGHSQNMEERDFLERLGAAFMRYKTKAEKKTQATKIIKSIINPKVGGLEGMSALSGLGGLGGKGGPSGKSGPFGGMDGL